MKGYLTDFGYIGFVLGRKILFATEDEYYDYMENSEEKEIYNEHGNYYECFS